ncbi:hypothetical protein A2U01_0003817 [Trifolium medium]|uniref:Uncharacterized protein n=1 Tax=Trifolium medium TaxID=97028 RepID=A0A392M788_9FABA|nr:hypothetical protein [Trifolium medium]
MAAQWKGSTNISWLLSQAAQHPCSHSAHANNSSSGDPLLGNTASCDFAFSNLAFDNHAFGDPVSDNPAPRSPASCDFAFGNFASNNLAFGGPVSGTPGSSNPASCDATFGNLASNNHVVENGPMKCQQWQGNQGLLLQTKGTVIEFSREGFFRNRKLR